MGTQPIAVTPAPPSSTFAPASVHADMHTVVTGARLWVARGVWAVGVTLYLGLFLLGIPAAYNHALVLSTETQTALARIGFAADFPAMYWLALDCLTIVGFAAIAFFIVIRRPNDWLVMLTSLTLLGTAVLYTAPAAEAPVPVLITGFAFAFAEICQVSFVYLFPNGRFVPRWMWVFLIPLFVWRPAIWSLVYLPNFYTLLRTGENYGTLPQGTLDTVLMLVLFVIGIGSQVYRYRRVATPIQKQQTKWLVFGIVGAISIAASYVIVVNALGLLESAGLEALVSRMIGRTLRQVGLFLLPVSLAFSILRYRLWDIDVLLRRTFIYVPLTAILAGLFAALVTVLQNMFVAMTGQGSVIAALVSTLVVVAAIDPLYEIIKGVVDRRFKGDADAQAQLNDFGERVQNRLSIVEPNQIVIRFCIEAMQAFRAAGGAAYLDHDGKLTRIATRGTWTDEPRAQVEIRTKDARVGAIALGARPFERPYTRADLTTLENVASIVGAAIVQDRELA